MGQDWYTKKTEYGPWMLDMSWNCLSSRWCKLHSLPVESLSIPAALGGFGITPWDGSSTISPRIPNVQRKGYNVKIKTQYRKQKLENRAIELGIPFAVDFDAAVNDQIKTVFSNDDIPDVAVLNRQDWKSKISKLEFKIDKVREKKSIYMDSTTLSQKTMSPRNLTEWRIFARDIYLRTRSYGKFQKYKNMVNDYKLFRKYALNRDEKPLSIMQWIKLKIPSLFAAVSSLRKKGHLTDVFDYLFGDINLGDNMIYPAMSDLYTRYCISLIIPNHRSRDVEMYYSTFRTSLLTSFTTNNVYRYCFSSR